MQTNTGPFPLQSSPIHSTGLSNGKNTHKCIKHPTSTLKMETVCFFEMLVYAYKSTRVKVRKTNVRKPKAVRSKTLTPFQVDMIKISFSRFEQEMAIKMDMIKTYEEARVNLMVSVNCVCCIASSQCCMKQRTSKQPRRALQKPTDPTPGRAWRRYELGSAQIRSLKRRQHRVITIKSFK
jgi:hypothetical protein